MNKRYLSDGVIELKLRKVERNAWFFPVVYFYDIYEYNKAEAIGRCDYRREKNEENYYAGNIGYMIMPNYRGKNYAYLASKLLCKLARRFKERYFYITCSPENIASYKTIKKLNADFIEEVDVPENHYLYKQGEKRKYIFKIKLDER